MLKKGIITLLLVFACSAFFSCTSMEWKEWEENKDYYQFLYVAEENTFIDYHLFTLMNNDHQIFHLLSKVRSIDEKPPFEEYEKIKSGFYYKLKINKIDSIIVLKSRFNFKVRGSPIILDEKINDKIIPLWSDDTLRIPAYTSENIYSLYVEILE